MVFEKKASTRIGIILLLISVSVLAGCLADNLPIGVSTIDLQKSIINFDWAPDSNRIVATVIEPAILFGTPSVNISIWEVGGSTFNQINDENSFFIDYPPRWHPFEEKILYTSDSDFGQYRVGIVDLQLMENHGLTKIGSVSDWISDGERVVTADENSLYMVNVSNMDIDKIWSTGRDQDIVSVAVSPSGEFIAVISSGSVSEKANQIFVLNENGDQERSLLESNSDISNIDWSPDGEWLTYISYEQEKLQARAISFDSLCKADPLPLDGDIRDIKWSPDGSEVMAPFTKGNDSGAYKIDTNSEFFTTWLESGNCS